VNTSPAAQPDPQPNVFGYEESFGFSPRFWVLVFLTGVGAGLGGAALMELLRFAEHLAWSYESGDFLTAVSNSTMTRRLEVLFGAGILVAIFRSVLRRPTGGHGTEVAAAIWFRSGELPFFRTLVRAVGSIIIVALGASLGREGAPKQVGAALAGALAKYGKLSCSQRRLLVACGAGAGLAAVYNVPLGGALFAVEILLGSLSLLLVLPAMATSLIAVTVSWLFLPNEATYSFPSYPFSPIALAGAVILGLLAAATPYGELLKRLLPLTARDLPLYVIDERGKLVGEVWADRVRQAENFAVPLETASAADLAIPAKALDSSLSPAAMNHQLDAEQLTHLPVTDTASKRLLGFYSKTPVS